MEKSLITSESYYFINKLSIFNAYLNIVICWSLFFFLSKPVMFLYEKNVDVSHFARRKDSRIPRGEWDWRIEKDDALSRRAKETNVRSLST